MDSIIVDVVIGVVLVVATCFMAYLGVHVTLHPIGPEDHAARRKRKREFILCGVLIAVVSVAQIVRNGIAQQDLIAKLEELKKNPKVEVNLPAPTIVHDSKPSPTNVPQTNTGVPLVAESPTSLRRRTLKLAEEITEFVMEREAPGKHPPRVYPNSNDPNPSEETKQAIKICRDYNLETEKQYMRKYRDRAVGIVKEYAAKGVPVGYLENDLMRGPPVVMPQDSVSAGTGSDTLFWFRSLAYRVDERDNAIHVSY